MKISLTDAGKRFNRDWIFRHLTYEFSAGQSYAIIGPNGSGKSTLLQALSGGMQLNEGSLEFGVRGSESGGITTENVYRHISICAPYLEVVEEMTLIEFLDFHSGFKPFLASITAEKIISILRLENAVNKQIRNYSSGMRQRVKLAQAIFSDVSVVLLDEPCTNLDSIGIQLYHDLINEYCKNRMVVVSSNDEVEYGFCGEKIVMSDYK
jgi:ABC-type multidrug transport system ATPase subunit